MRTWLSLALLAAASLASRPAVACELDKTLKVVGFDAKYEQVLVREESALTLDLVTVELATGKQTGSYSILEYNDDDAKRPTLRARRWKQELASDASTARYSSSPDFAFARCASLSTSAASAVQPV